LNLERHARQQLFRDYSMSFDAYAPCPCGSGEKFKWCCQKVEPDAERAKRLLDGNQLEAATEAIDEGLRKVPDNPWLLTRKAVIELHRGHNKQAKALLERLLARHPEHVGALAYLTSIALQEEGAKSGVAGLQRALSACRPDRRPALAVIAHLVGMKLADEGFIPAAIEHFTLGLELNEGDDELIESALRAVLHNASESAYERNIYELSPPPDNLSKPLRERFEQAKNWAAQGLWNSAAAAFESLSASGVALADRNCGLCRLWVADGAGAVAALRRYIAKTGETDDCVDLEALCQIVAPVREDDQVELVQLIWHPRDRDRLLNALKADPTVVAEGKSPIDPTDEDSPEVDVFLLLDRPQGAEGWVPDDPEELPVILGRVHVGVDIVALETHDDGNMDGLVARLRNLAGPAIPPAHPRTKVLHKAPKSLLALRTELFMPKGLSPEGAQSLMRRAREAIVKSRWPETPLPSLQGRTPRKAARDGNARVGLRAALCQLEINNDEIDLTELRRSLGIPPEPEIDPGTVSIDDLHLSRLHLVPAERLDDERLIPLFERAQAASLPRALGRACRALVARPALLESGNVDRVNVYDALSKLALAHNEKAEAFDWLARGRQTDPPAERARNAPRWDILEIQIASATERPEEWVPRLAVVLERYQGNREANSVIVSFLVQMGLIQLVRDPNSPDQVFADSRGLQYLIERYGPKITTAGGRLGVSATSGGIWTPAAAAQAGQAGAIWTPGASSPPVSDDTARSKLIVPGR
jgi:tetratricopeptide (TPR) repeat protein